MENLHAQEKKRSPKDAGHEVGWGPVPPPRAGPASPQAIWGQMTPGGGWAADCTAPWPREEEKGRELGGWGEAFLPLSSCGGWGDTSRGHSTSVCALCSEKHCTGLGPGVLLLSQSQTQLQKGFLCEKKKKKKMKPSDLPPWPGGCCIRLSAASQGSQPCPAACAGPRSPRWPRAGGTALPAAGS